MNEPLLVLPWCIISNSDSVLVSTNMFSYLKGSIFRHSSSDSKSKTIVVWESGSLLTILVEPPALVGTVVAVPEDYVSVISVGSTMDIKAFFTVVLDVSS
jgi:hypothetical protein